jgi:hypothetical protein
MIKRIILIVFIFSLLTFLLPKNIYADSNFSTDYNVTYTVDTKANTHVNISAALTNLTTNYYASSYSVEVGFTDIKNIVVSDTKGLISPKITKSAKGNTITLNFNDQSVGLNNKLLFNISFDTGEIAQNYNNVWDINIPGIANQADFSTFNSTLIYPSSLGSATYIKPLLLNKQANISGNKLTFTKDDLGESGISVAFGNFQTYNFNLTYHLENTNLFPISTEIALPPSTNYQDVSIENIIPKPTNVKLDKDGNWLAQYIISPHKKMNVNVLGKTKVYLYPKEEDLDNKSLQDYLKSQPYWESNNPRILNLAKDLKTPYAIYQYVLKTLTYDFSRVEKNNPRLGALEALKNPTSAVCLEFTDLFIALSRAAGIPAREIDGYAYTNNTSERPLSLSSDILHAWPEYYDFDKKTWIMVDPTWGNTTGGIDYFNALDFDHIAFVVKGEVSNYPIPAGGYKLLKSEKNKDVNVVLGNTFDQTIEKISIDPQISENILAGLPIDGYIKISNIGESLITKQEINVATDFLTPKNQTIFNQDIPPFGYILLPISFKRTPILTNAADTIKITVGNNHTSYKKIRIIPFFVNRVFVLGGIIFVSFCIIISLVAYLFGRLSLFKPKE